LQSPKSDYDVCPAKKYPAMRGVRFGGRCIRINSRTGAAMPARSIKLMLLITAFAVVGAAHAENDKRHKHVKHMKAVHAATAHGQYRGTDKFPAGPLYYNGGEYLGDDPDPNIRFQIWRDLGAHFGGDD
jgi:hypothetical protein